VRAWLLRLGLASAVAARFEEEEIGGEALLVLRAPELAELGVSLLGPRTVLLSRIRELKLGRKGCREDLPAEDVMAGVDVAEWLAGQGVAEGVVRRYARKRQGLGGMDVAVIVRCLCARFVPYPPVAIRSQAVLELLACKLCSRVAVLAGVCVRACVYSRASATWHARTHTFTPAPDPSHTHTRARLCAGS
jgi:hypothetical protein